MLNATNGYARIVTGMPARTVLGSATPAMNNADAARAVQIGSAPTVRDVRNASLTSGAKAAERARHAPH